MSSEYTPVLHIHSHSTLIAIFRVAFIRLPVSYMMGLCFKVLLQGQRLCFTEVYKITHQFKHLYQTFIKLEVFLGQLCTGKLWIKSQCSLTQGRMIQGFQYSSHTFYKISDVSELSMNFLSSVFYQFQKRPKGQSQKEGSRDMQDQLHTNISFMTLVSSWGQDGSLVSELSQ